MTTGNQNKEADTLRVQGAVSSQLTNLTASALAAAMGSTMVLKMEMTGSGKTKYVPCKTEAEIIQALEWISEYGNSLNPHEEGFYIIQQQKPDAKFWDALMNRHLGKVADESKIDLTNKIDLVAIGKKAALNTVHAQKEVDPLPPSWREITA